LLEVSGYGTIWNETIMPDAEVSLKAFNTSASLGVESAIKITPKCVPTGGTDKMFVSS